MRATIPKPVIAILALLLVVPTSVGAVSIVSNVKIHTPVADGIRTFTVMVFDDGGKILATGGNELSARFPGAVRIDGQGKSVLPSLIDEAMSLVEAKLPAATRDDIRVLETWVGGKRVYAYTETAEAAER